MEENKRKSMDYQNAKVYKIICNVTNKIYVGSTCKPRLCDRLGQHAAMYRAYLKGKHKSRYTSFDVLEGGDYKIYLLERYPCETKEELLKKERDYIEQLECINKNIPGRSRKEYREANKERLNQKSKEYRKANKEYNKVYKKEHYQKNKQKINERVSEKVKCECGCEVRRDNLAKHRKTKKHLDKMIQFNDNSD